MTNSGPPSPPAQGCPLHLGAMPIPRMLASLLLIGTAGDRPGDGYAHVQDVSSGFFHLC